MFKEVCQVLGKLWRVCIWYGDIDTGFIGFNSIFNNNIMYKIYQNYLQSNEHEYAHDYEDIAEARKDIEKYEREDMDNGRYDNYTIVDMEDFEDIEDKEKRLFDNMAMSAMRDIGLSDDEAVNMLEDFK